jgi:hypothetical protein
MRERRPRITQELYPGYIVFGSWKGDLAAFAGVARERSFT